MFKKIQKNLLVLVLRTTILTMALWPMAYGCTTTRSTTIAIIVVFERKKYIYPNSIHLITL